MDKLNAISLFCKVIETQSFTAAAQQAQISLAMASKLVSQLEAQLNVRLLHRTTRKITPTEAGLIYYQRCSAILNDIQEAENSISNINTSLQGKVAISLPMDFGSRFIAPHLGRFLAQYPHLELHLDFSDRRVDLVAESYDLALRIGQLEDSSIVARKIGESQHILVASPTYLTENGLPQSLTELEHHNCLLYERQQTWIFQQNGEEIKIRPKSNIISNNGYALVQMAKAHLGLLYLPKFLVKEELATGDLVPVLAHSSIQSDRVDISLLYPHRRYLSPKVKVLIEFLRLLMQEQQADLVQ